MNFLNVQVESDLVNRSAELSLERTVGNVLKSIVLTLVKVVTSRFDRHIILGGYDVLLETAYNL